MARAVLVVVVVVDVTPPVVQAVSEEEAPEEAEVLRKPEELEVLVEAVVVVRTVDQAIQEVAAVWVVLVVETVVRVSQLLAEEAVVALD